MRTPHLGRVHWQVAATIGRACTAMLFALATASLPGCDRVSAERTMPQSSAAHSFLVHHLDSLEQSLAALDNALARSTDMRGDSTRAAFRAARRVFKRVEALLAYAMPVETASLNGPRVEGDDDDPNPPPKSAPVGFQVIEAALYDSSATLDEARREISRMREMLSAQRAIVATMSLPPNVVVDAARLQLGRVSTLSIAGIDADQSGDAIVEAAYALEGVRDVLLAVLRDPDARAVTDAAFSRAVAELRANPDFLSFNRLRFIVNSVLPAGRAVTRAQEETGLPERGVRRFWRENAGTPYDSAAFSPYAFPPAHARPSSNALETAGERLFFDVRLSGGGERSCASCHQVTRAFTDGLARATMLDADKPSILRNTPTLLNVAMQLAFFADDRARSLETQVGAVLESPAEMASSVNKVAERVTADSAYRVLFAAAMPDRGDSAITGLEVRQALAAYLRTLVAMNSRFDRAVRGDTLALNADERFGFTVFMGKGKCGTCHFAPLFNGLTPPFYQTSESEIIGVPAEADLDHPRLDGDIGRAHVEDTPLNRFAFKVTSLRNVALTAPYMHNGVFRTLEDVVEFYNRGGGVGLGMDIPYQSLPPTPLQLTEQEKKGLVAFMKSLTDTVTRRAPYRERP